MSMLTQTEADNASVPPASVEAPGRGNGVAKAIAIIAGVLGVALVAMSMVTVPYYSQSPGSATPLESVIEVRGADEFPSDGEVFFTTVRLTGELSVLEWMGAWFDDSVDIRPKDEVLGTQTRDEQRQQNLQLMAQSQEIAKRVALSYLGYDVVIPDGALIGRVVEGSGSEGVVEPGDVVIAVEGATIADGSGLVDAIQSRSPGDELQLTVRRLPETGDAEEIDLTVVLGSGADGGPQMGVEVGTSFDLVDLPFEIDVDTAAVGGPSAGLALSLSILDILTEGELTGGLAVATTGTVDVFGNVGPIGGVEQKAHAVRRAGIDLFLVPTADFEAAQSAAGDDLTVVAVDTFADAVAELAARGGNGLELAGSAA